VTGERYVILGLAPPRAPWFDALAQWTTSAAIAGEFIKCVSVEEVRVRLASGRRHSVVLIDASLPALDRDLVDLASEVSTPVVVVRDSRGPLVPIRDLGVTAELPPGFNRQDLVETLAAHCVMVGRGDDLPPAVSEPPGSPWQGQLFSVCGPGGTGASTLAMSLAQGLSADPRHGRRVLLADLARRADLAMLHDAVDLGPGLQELVDAHRVRRPDGEEIRRMTFDVPRRGYCLLLGLRQAEAWASLRPRAIDAAVEGMRRSFQAVVADITGDFEGESEGGSIDVEERNHLARAAALRSTVLVVVGNPGLKGIHSLAGVIRAAVRIGVAPGRIVAVVNRSPRNPRARAESARALAVLLEGAGIQLTLAAPVSVPERKLDDPIRDGIALPAAVVDPVTRAVASLMDRLADEAPPWANPTRVQPGSLGSWSPGAGLGSG
jgi:MinD-like ATPase involved in chromosome partitioning or flagellar assembly